MQAPSFSNVLLPVFLAAVLLTGCGNDDDDPSSSTPAVSGGNSSASSQNSGGQGGGSSASTDIPSVVQSLAPSVVAIAVEADGAEGAGSGVIWNGDGVIVTNNHVVEGASNVTVVLVSGERIPATVTATDPLTDLAILKVNRQGLTAAHFADALPLVGETAITVGNPLGFENTVSAGIVSGLHRSIPSGGTTPALVDLIQTDAAISPGNSGGAMANAEGQIIGIVVAYIPPAEGAVALGFAIPSPTVTNVVEQLLENGKAEHAFLGIEPRPLTPGAAQQLGLAVNEGVFIFSVTPGSAAEKGGLQPGDVITQFDRQPVDAVEDLYSGLRNKQPGDDVPITVNRAGRDIQLDVTLDARPPE